MGNLSGFNPATVPVDNDRDVLPAGDYVVAIIGSDVKDSRSGGRYINFTLEIIDGDHAGRRVWDICNLWNASEKAVEIAQRTLASICRATGVMSPTDTSELHGIPIGVKLGVEPDTGYGPKNKVKKYYPIDGDAPAPPAPAAPAGPAWKTKRTETETKKPKEWGKRPTAPIGDDDIPF